MSLPPGLLPARVPGTHKGDVGHVAVVAGSEGLTGAAALCSMGALRSGAGLVTVALPKSLHDVMEVKVTEVMTMPLPETKARSLSLAALAPLASFIEGIDAVALGPGLSRQSQTGELVRQLLGKVAKPCVVDADGLYALAEDPQHLKRLTTQMIITPHPGEMGRLIRQSAQDVQGDRERTAKDFASRFGVVTVLKGHQSVVADVDGTLWVNGTGNPGMATGGCGDVLTGVIAALLGQGLSLFDAARLGVHLHGLAGDLAANARGSVGLIASDLLDTLPAAIQEYQRGGRD